MNRRTVAHRKRCHKQRTRIRSGVRDAKARLLMGGDYDLEPCHGGKNYCCVDSWKYCVECRERLPPTAALYGSIGVCGTTCLLNHKLRGRIPSMLRRVLIGDDNHGQLLQRARCVDSTRMLVNRWLPDPLQRMIRAYLGGCSFGCSGGRFVFQPALHSAFEPWDLVFCSAWEVMTSIERTSDIPCIVCRPECLPSLVQRLGALTPYNTCHNATCFSFRNGHGRCAEEKLMCSEC